MGVRMREGFTRKGPPAKTCVPVLAVACCPSLLLALVCGCVPVVVVITVCLLLLGLAWCYCSLLQVIVVVRTCVVTPACVCGSIRLLAVAYVRCCSPLIASPSPPACFSLFLLGLLCVCLPLSVSVCCCVRFCDRCCCCCSCCCDCCCRRRLSVVCVSNAAHA